MENSQPSRKIWSGDLLRLALAALVIVGLFRYFLLGGWPPNWVDRRTERKILIDRVQAAGGWTALQRACDALVEQHQDTGFHWLERDDTNKVPPAIVALKPQDVSFNSPSVPRGSSEEEEFLVVDIKIFGRHATGGHSSPYFGLEVVSGTNAENYTPHPRILGASGNNADSYRKVTNRIYEIY
jgi:hypothetical protein